MNPIVRTTLISALVFVVLSRTGVPGIVPAKG